MSNNFRRFSLVLLSPFTTNGSIKNELKFWEKEIQDLVPYQSYDEVQQLIRLAGQGGEDFAVLT